MDNFLKKSKNNKIFTSPLQSGSLLITDLLFPFFKDRKGEVRNSQTPTLKGGRSFFSKKIYKRYNFKNFISAKFEMQILDFNTRDVLVTTGTFSPIRQLGTPQSSSFPAVWRQCIICGYNRTHRYDCFVSVVCK